MVDNKLNGLSAEEVLKSRETHGDNVITPVKKESVWQLFIEKFNDPIIKVLIVAACLSLVIAIIDGEYLETIGIFSAIFLATGVAFWFEYDAKRRFDILNTVNDEVAITVIRDGDIMTIPRRDVVVGDIVVLESGEEVAADGVLLEAVSLHINESTLTGEPMISKTIDEKLFDDEATYPSNMVMRGTSVIEGHAIMEVMTVGDNTEFGKVAEQSTISTEEKTPLNKQLDKLSVIIGKIGTALSILIFLVLIIKGLFFTKDLMTDDWLHISKTVLEYFMISVALMVMAIPEGLPMSITLSLAMSMRRMLKTNNLVRKMHACETMGAVTVICTDKTGTLTQNQMRVYEMKGYNSYSQELINSAISVNSTAFVDKEGAVIGNPTEGALLLWLKDLGVDYAENREKAVVVDQMTFTTERKYMATLIKGETDNILFVKGAPEIVRALAKEDGNKSEIEETLRTFQGKAMRTLGFAMCHTNATTCEEAIESKTLEFFAVAAISDPVRLDVPEAVQNCINAGINIKMVTGDTSITAREIARQVGLWSDDVDGDRNEITGVEFGLMSDEELLERVGDLKIMSRARPLDKQRLVKLLQKKGEVVAVTGDGTNDAPALNYAQVGLSMGSGTSVAKEASDITLLDDSFASIVTAIMWGRSLYVNIQRFVLFQLTINFTALIVVFFGSIFGSEMPLTVTQILWVNIIMDTFAAMALASLPPNPLVMKDKPRKPTDFIITKSMMRSIVGVGSVFVIVLLSVFFGYGQNLEGEELAHFSAIFFSIFVMFQFWNMFNAKAYGTKELACSKLKDAKWFLVILLVILVGQIVIVSFGGGLFRVNPLSLNEWFMVIGGTSLVFIAGEVYRFFKK